MKQMEIAVDFDGTCVDHRYPQIGPEPPLCIQTLKDLTNQGHKLILFTMRSGKGLSDAVQWFSNNGVTLYGVQKNPTQEQWTTSNKCHADMFIDDLAFGAPLIQPEGFFRKCIDWSKVRAHFNLK